jgi:hypothetical protein
MILIPTGHHSSAPGMRRAGFDGILFSELSGAARSSEIAPSVIIRGSSQPETPC